MLVPLDHLLHFHAPLLRLLRLRLHLRLLLLLRPMERHGDPVYPALWSYIKQEQYNKRNDQEFNYCKSIICVTVTTIPVEINYSTLLCSFIYSSIHLFLGLISIICYRFHQWLSYLLNWFIKYFNSALDVIFRKFFWNKSIILSIKFPSFYKSNRMKSNWGHYFITSTKPHQRIIGVVINDLTKRNCRWQVQFFFFYILISFFYIISFFFYFERNLWFDCV